jgi:hypothetical protein
LPEEGAIAHPITLQTLDELLATEPRIDFIKIDAEGGEADIVAGMQGVLKRHRPHLLIEFNMGHAYDGMALVDSLLTHYGAMSFVEGNGRALPITPQVAAEQARGKDLMLYFAP